MIRENVKRKSGAFSAATIAGTVSNILVTAKVVSGYCRLADTRTFGP